MRRACTLLLLLVPPTTGAADPPKFDPAADQKRLQGVWETKTGVRTARIEIDVKEPGIILRVKGPGFGITLRDLNKTGFALKEVGGKTVIRLNEELAKVSDLPRDIEYKLIDDELIVTVTGGPGRGEYRLTRVRKK